MMKRRWKGFIAVTIAATMMIGMSLSTLAADGVPVTTPTAGNAEVTQSGSNWYSENDDDAILKDTDTDGSQIGVFAKVSIEGKSVYKVDIAWGAMKFAYTNSSRVWDPETHTYGDTNEGTVGWDATLVDGTNNKITITNHSNSAINTSLAYAHNLTGAKSSFNEDSTAANSVRGHFFDANEKAITAASVLAASATVVDELDAAPFTIAACPEGATVLAGDIPSDDVFFTFNGTPDPEASDALSADFVKVGVITVTIGS